MFEGYFSHRGRIGRLRLLKLNLLNLLALAFLSASIYLLYRLTESPFVWILMILSLPIVYSNMMLAIKRLHDLNLSGWWLLWLTLIDVVLDLIDESGMLNYAFSIVQFALYWLARGTDGPNRFGPKPAAARDIPPESGDAASVGTPA
jgi:uncharacterized membrane protein YhaH (DUF805 family)